MFPKSFSNFTFYQKKKDILIYKAADSNHQYILKCSENTTPALKPVSYTHLTLPTKLEV